MTWEDTWTHSQNSCIDRAQSLPKSSRSIVSPLHVWLLWFRGNLSEMWQEGGRDLSLLRPRGYDKKGRFIKCFAVHVVFLNYFCISYFGRVKLFALMPHELLSEILGILTTNIFLCVLRICALIVFTHYCEWLKCFEEWWTLMYLYLYLLHLK